MTFPVCLYNNHCRRRCGSKQNKRNPPPPRNLRAICNIRITQRVLFGFFVHCSAQLNNTEHFIPLAMTQTLRKNQTNQNRKWTHNLRLIDDGSTCVCVCVLHVNSNETITDCRYEVEKNVHTRKLFLDENNWIEFQKRITSSALVDGQRATGRS